MWFLIASALTLGPANIPQTEPFPLSQEYSSDFKAAQPCDRTPDGEAILKGSKAVYGEKNGAVTVYLDEYARRFALDYCWK